MGAEKHDNGEDARNRGVEERTEDLREPEQHPPREAVERPGPPEPDPVTEEEPAAPEQLENPPQIEGPRERSNRPGG